MGVIEWYDYFQELFVPLSNKLIIALVLILIGMIVGRIAARLTQKLLQDLKLNEMVNAALGIKVSVEELSSMAVRYFIYLVFLITALNQLGITTFIIEVITASLLVMVLLSLFLAVKDFIPNFVAGWKLQRGEFLKEGDNIKVDGIEGKVQKIQLTDTLIKTKKSDFISVPNSYLTKLPLTRAKRK